MEKRKHTPPVLALAILLFEGSHLAYEHFSGGVASHHLLNRSDLPAISNWLGLLILPVLGWALGVRVRNQSTQSGLLGVPLVIWFGFVGSMLYGAGLAVSFQLGASTISSSMFFGLFVLAVLLPIYRAEYILGFVVGMTFTFGGVLPSMVAAVFATVSVALRFCFRAAAAGVRKIMASRSGAT